MIVGHGDIASALKDRSGFVFFASGVSNSQESRESEYQREKELLLRQDHSLRLVYFGSLSVFYPVVTKYSNPRYAEHKLEMEELVKTTFPHYTIVRLGNIIWGKNPNTLVNKIRKLLKDGESFEIPDTYRYLVTKEEFLHWMDVIPDRNCEINIPGERVKIEEVVKRIKAGQFPEEVPISEMLSVIIPNRNSPFTTKTIQDVLEKARGNVEVIVTVGENWPEPLFEDKRVTYIHPGSVRGMRWGINAGVALAKGKYIMKTDDHCMFGPGFDRILIENHLEDNWVQIPRRYSLDAEKWEINQSRPYRDYMYLCYPAKGKAHDDGMHGVEWFSRQRERTDHGYDIDDTPSLQGSCYFMTKNHFDNFLGGLSEEGYGQFAQEAQEIGNKTWLGGGAVKVNKKTWYAHLHKGRHYGRMYRFSDTENVRGVNWSAEYWMNNRWPGKIHDIAWLVNEKFPGMPTWPADWQEIYYGN